MMIVINNFSDCFPGLGEAGELVVNPFLNLHQLVKSQLPRLLDQLFDGCQRDSQVLQAQNKEQVIQLVIVVITIARGRLLLGLEDSLLVVIQQGPPGRVR